MYAPLAALATLPFEMQKKTLLSFIDIPYLIHNALIGALFKGPNHLRQITLLNLLYEQGERKIMILIHRVVYFIQNKGLLNLSLFPEYCALFILAPTPHRGLLCTTYYALTRDNPIGSSN